MIEHGIVHDPQASDAVTLNDPRRHVRKTSRHTKAPALDLREHLAAAWRSATTCGYSCCIVNSDWP